MLEFEIIESEIILRDDLTTLATISQQPWGYLIQHETHTPDNLKQIQIVIGKNSVPPISDENLLDVICRIGEHTNCPMYVREWLGMDNI